MQQKPSEFTVKDKRLFNPDGTPREEETPAESNKNTGFKPDEAKTEPEPPLKNEAFEINFSTFILSLASSVQISLGLIPHPATQKPEVNLVGAKQTIDILEMIRTKTKGNLDHNEEMLLNQVIYELQMMYVEVQKKHA